MRENPEISVLRESLIPFMRAYSFAATYDKSNRPVTMSHVDKLNLIYQFLQMEGLSESAKMLKEECGIPLTANHTGDVRLFTVLKVRFVASFLSRAKTNVMSRSLLNGTTVFGT